MRVMLLETHCSVAFSFRMIESLAIVELRSVMHVHHALLDTCPCIVCKENAS